MRTTTIGWTTGAGGATPGDAPTGPDDDRPADALAQDAVGAPDVAGRLRGDGGRLEPQARLAHGGRGLADHGVGRGTAVLEREVEPHQLEVEPEHVGVEDPQRLVEQLLAGLVAVADDDLPAGDTRSGSRRDRADAVATRGPPSLS